MQTEDLKESSKQTTAEETPQQEAQTNTADAANGVDETAGKKSEGAAEENYLCSACGREFSAASAQTVEVDDQALDAALAELKAKKSEAAKAAGRF